MTQMLLVTLKLTDFFNACKALNISYLQNFTKVKVNVKILWPS